MVLNWDPDVALYIKQELFKLHRSSRHPRVNALDNFLRKARPEDYSTEVKTALDAIFKELKTCVKHARNRGRLKLTTRHEGLLPTILSRSISFISKETGTGRRG